MEETEATPAERSDTERDRGEHGAHDGDGGAPMAASAKTLEEEIEREGDLGGARVARESGEALIHLQLEPRLAVEHRRGGGGGGAGAAIAGVRPRAVHEQEEEGDRELGWAGYCRP